MLKLSKKCHFLFFQVAFSGSFSTFFRIFLDHQNFSFWKAYMLEHFRIEKKKFLFHFVMHGLILAKIANFLKIVDKMCLLSSYHTKSCLIPYSVWGLNTRSCEHVLIVLRSKNDFFKSCGKRNYFEFFRLRTKKQCVRNMYKIRTRSFWKKCAGEWI